MRIRNGIQIEYISSAWMVIEVLGSMGFVVIAGSFALMAFGGDSLIELISGIAVLAGLRKDSSTSTSDERHSKKTEQLTSGLLFALIPAIGSGAVFSYLMGLKPEGSALGIAIAIGAVIVMPYFYVEKKRIGRETRSLPLSIDAIESVTCLFMAIALLVGVAAEYFLGLWWADYLATGVILAFVAREAVESYWNFTKNERSLFIGESAAGGGVSVALSPSCHPFRFWNFVEISPGLHGYDHPLTQGNVSVFPYVALQIQRAPKA